MNDQPSDDPGLTPPGAEPRRTRTNQRWLMGAAAVVLGLMVAIGGLNCVLVANVVRQKLAVDARNSKFTLWAHYRWFVDPGTLVLDLRRTEAAAPIDLFRGLFQSAAALSIAGRKFDRVVLARSGEPIFLLKGEAFATLGHEFEAGQNPVFLIRTLPEKLFKPSGEGAFPTWSGGVLGVVGKQMEDVNTAAQQWAAIP